jgi:hypothetical protein
MSKKKALVVGINEFKHLPSATLRGCVNDAHDMAAYLEDVQGFKKKDITILTDADATKKAIIANLTKLVESAKAGKITHLVFSFSSHGTQIPDIDGDENIEMIDNVKTRADEAFCPYDLKQKGDSWDPKHIISDDEFHDLFASVPESCVIEVFLDTCHSGTGIKVIDLLGFADVPRPRFLPPPSLKAFEIFKNKELKPLKRSIVSEQKTMSASDAIARKGAILWTGCRSDQTSADAVFDNRPNGAFTYYYLKTVRANPNATRQNIHMLLKAELRKGKFKQVPQLEFNATDRS